MVKHTIRKLVAQSTMSFLVCSVAVGTVMADAVPQYGKYVAEGENYSITITSTKSSIGQITAEYKANNSQVGPLKVSGNIGKYSWVYSNSQGKRSHVAPFGIRFDMSVRPSGYQYNIYDSWTGAYQVDNSLLMSGVRSYINNDGIVEVRSLGTKKFSK
jgi:hypothetical protein